METHTHPIPRYHKCYHVLEPAFGRSRSNPLEQLKRAEGFGINQEVSRLRLLNQQQEPEPTRCRDCPALFVKDDPRRRLCDFCRWLHKRTIGNRASRKWWSQTSPEYRKDLYRVQYFREKRRALRRRKAA